MQYYIAQTIGFFGVFIFFYSVQFKDKHNILLAQSIANLLYGISYFLLFVPIAGLMNIVSVIRCYLFSKYDKEKKQIPKKYFYIFSLLIIIIGIFTFDGIISLIPICITLLYTYSSFQKDVKKFRIIFMICALIWMYYNFKVGALMSLMGNVFEFTSGVVSLIRYREKK